MDDEVLFDAMNSFDDIMSGRNTGHISALPDRDFIALVYKFIRSKGKWRYDNEILCKRLGLDAASYAKVCVALEALTELGTIVYDGDGNLTLPQENIKVNLNDAPVLKRIKEIEG